MITKDRTTEPTQTSAVIMEGEREILISDKLTSSQGVVIEDVGEGVWRFKNEEGTRKTEPHGNLDYKCPSFWPKAKPPFSIYLKRVG